MSEKILVNVHTVLGPVGFQGERVSVCYLLVIKDELDAHNTDPMSVFKFRYGGSRYSDSRASHELTPARQLTSKQVKTLRKEWHQLVPNASRPPKIMPHSGA